MVLGFLLWWPLLFCALRLEVKVRFAGTSREDWRVQATTRR